MRFFNIPCTLLEINDVWQKISMHVGIQRQNLKTIKRDMIQQYLALEKLGYFSNSAVTR